MHTSIPLGPLARLCAVRVRLFRHSPWSTAFLHDLLRPSRPAVRSLRLYAAVRLPIAVLVGLTADRLLPPFRPLPAVESHRGSRFSRAQRAPRFLCMPGSTAPQGLQRTSVQLAPQCCLPVCLPPSAPLILATSELIKLQGYPRLHVPLSNASSAPLPPSCLRPEAPLPRSPRSHTIRSYCGYFQQGRR
jgi:hypothetical protein